MIATGTALAIAAAASAGSSVTAAKISSNASKNAAKTQQASVDKAQQFNQLAYNDQKTALNPYLQAGQYSLGQLMARQYGGPSFEQNVNGYVQNAQRGLPPGMVPGGMAAPSGAPLPSGNATSMGALMGGQFSAPPMQQPMGGPPAGGMVLMEGPDGSRKMIPQANVPEAQRRGARVVQ